MSTTTTSPLPPTTPHQRSSATTTRRLSWAWVALSSIAIAVYAATPYFLTPLRQLAEEHFGLAPAYSGAPTVVQYAFYAHAALGGIALLIGSLQFSARFRRRFPVAHRAIGTVYLVSVALAGTAALVMAPFNSAAIVGFFGFATLDILWLFSAVKAYRAIRSRDVRSHQAWMIRNYAMTYGAVTLRAIVGIGIPLQLALSGGTMDLGVAFENVYMAVPFLAWLPNVVVAEIMVRRRGLPGLRWVSDPA